MQSGISASLNLIGKVSFTVSFSRLSQHKNSYLLQMVERFFRSFRQNVGHSCPLCLFIQEFLVEIFARDILSNVFSHTQDLFKLLEDFTLSVRAHLVWVQKPLLVKPKPNYSKLRNLASRYLFCFCFFRRFISTVRCLFRARS